ncbi:glutamate mutase L [Natranaerobius thermophilus]|uniref:Glutamate mutase, MutL n=1 Tax=Natranaerobius thermophilus (strain ATCC BAA-1301 / DSM 18059 / JW/NM-WN-LF) TaxID=457570 RepID=B2A7L2_NATTJ|nr:glutamate mutase L [Natranaerobius thermophilus]ACB85721.1 glutamate mutase, MutL [Natranaerobius thermophilus JW/NM-WN-LF]
MSVFDYLVIDIGSTFLKQRLFKDSSLVATTQLPTTLKDVYQGYQSGKQKLQNDLAVDEIDPKNFLATSSAAGGLRMVAMGYMSRVTAKASKEVAMNAGAKILEVISHEDTPEYRLEILKEINPDIILLAGGTDSGDETSLIENAEIIVESDVNSLVIIAGNIKAQKKAAQILEDGGVNYTRVSNIMPTIHELKVTEARDAIHREFIKQITEAKGSDQLVKELSTSQIVPTPGAVLLGAELLAKGTYKDEGLGGVVVVDLGGATTDVHSILPELEELEDEEKGLVVSNEKQEAYRTVEGNLGLRVSALGVIETMHPKNILSKSNLDPNEYEEGFRNYCNYIEENTNHVATNEQEELFDSLLAETAVEVALKRHAGYISKEADPVMGIVPGTPIGRDLRKVKKVIAVGGYFSHRSPEQGEEIINNVIQNPGISLLPTEPEIIIDEKYLLFAAGVISRVDEDYAFQILKQAYQL